MFLIENCINPLYSPFFPLIQWKYIWVSVEKSKWNPFSLSLGQINSRRSNLGCSSMLDCLGCLNMILDERKRKFIEMADSLKISKILVVHLMHEYVALRKILTKIWMTIISESPSLAAILSNNITNNNIVKQN